MEMAVMALTGFTRDRGGSRGRQGARPSKR